MKSLITKTALFLIAIFAINTSASAKSSDYHDLEFYEWRYYSVTNGNDAELDKFLEKVLIPAYERQGVKTGVFEIAPEYMDAKQLAAQKGRPEQRIVLFVYNDIDSYLKIKDAIWDDVKFTKNAKSYFDAWETKPAYSKLESYLCISFANLPQIDMPSKSDEIFELRRYKSANEEAGQRKIDMFNNGEIAVFKDVKIHQVCYGEVLAGAEMPSLIYLTSYKNNKQRLSAWEDFEENKKWKKLSKEKEYRNTVQNANVEIIRRMPYSKFQK